MATRSLLASACFVLIASAAARADTFLTSGGSSDPFKITAFDCGGCESNPSFGLPAILPADPVMIPDSLRPKKWVDFEKFGSAAEWVSYGITGKETGPSSGVYKTSLLSVIPNMSIATFTLVLPGSAGIGDIMVGADDTVRVTLVDGSGSTVLFPFPADLDNNGPCQLDIVGCQGQYVGFEELTYSGAGSFITFEVIQTHAMAFGFISEVNAFPGRSVLIPEPTSAGLLGMALALLGLHCLASHRPR